MGASLRDGGSRIKVERSWVCTPEHTVGAYAIICVSGGCEAVGSRVGAAKEDVDAAALEESSCGRVVVQGTLDDCAAEYGIFAQHLRVVGRREAHVVDGGRVGASKSVVRALYAAVAGCIWIVRGRRRVLAPRGELPPPLLLLPRLLLIMLVVCFSIRLCAKLTHSAAAAAVIEGGSGAVAHVALIRAASNRARAVINVVCRVVVECQGAGAARIERSAQSGIDRGHRVKVAAYRVSASHKHTLDLLPSK